MSQSINPRIVAVRQHSVRARQPICPCPLWRLITKRYTGIDLTALDQIPCSIRPRYQRWLIIAILALSSLLAACGQKGPLYLPEPEQDEQIDKQ